MAATQPTVNVPVVGTVQRRWVIYGAAAVVLVVGYFYVRRARSANASTVEINPATGTAAGDVTGYVNPAPRDGSGAPVQSDTTMRTNADWVNDVIAKLAGLNINAQYIAVTLGKYLAGQPLDLSEQQLVRTAWGVAGYPPNYVDIVPAAQTPTTTTPPVDNAPPVTTPPAQNARRFVLAHKYIDGSDPLSYLSGIASSYGRSTGQLQQWNGIADPNFILNQQKIYVDPPGSYSGETQVG